MQNILNILQGWLDEKYEDLRTNFGGITTDRRGGDGVWGMRRFRQRMVESDSNIDKRSVAWLVRQVQSTNVLKLTP